MFFEAIRAFAFAKNTSNMRPILLYQTYIKLVLLALLDSKMKSDFRFQAA